MGGSEQDVFYKAAIKRASFAKIIASCKGKVYINPPIVNQSMKRRINRQISVLTASAILKALNDNKVEIKRYRAKRLGLFGSFSKGTAHSKSDLDFIVKFKKLNFDDYMDLKFLLEKMSKRKVDLVLEENLKPSLNYIKKEAKYVSGL